MRHIVRPVCAVLGCRLVRVRTRSPNWTDPPGYPTTLYRCTRCQLELWH